MPIQILIGSKLYPLYIRRSSSHNVIRSAWLLLFATFSFLWEGCAFGPKYVYVPQGNSAVISVARSSNVVVCIDHVDGFAAPIKMQCGFTTGTYVLYVSPGTHKFDLTLESDWTTSRGAHDVNESVLGGGNIEYSFKAGGKYHITGLYGYSGVFEATLWDDSEGVARKVRTWQFKAV